MIIIDVEYNDRLENYEYGIFRISSDDYYSGYCIIMLYGDWDGNLNGDGDRNEK